jgi:hypothetical protein
MVGGKAMEIKKLFESREMPGQKISEFKKEDGVSDPEYKNRVVQKLKFLNNNRLKMAKCGAFCRTCSRTNRVFEQV